jgi:hypothetical protein
MDHTTIQEQQMKI